MLNVRSHVLQKLEYLLLNYQIAQASIARRKSRKSKQETRRRLQQMDFSWSPLPPSSYALHTYMHWNVNGSLYYR
jgi:hypothetical protein